MASMEVDNIAKLMKSDVSYNIVLNRASENGEDVKGIMSYEDALNFVRDELEKKSKSKKVLNPDDLNGLKDKEMYRKRMQQYKEEISSIIALEGIRVAGYEHEHKPEDRTTEDLIRDIAADFVGFSVLEEAMEDPGVTDIFVMSYELIYVEKYGKNEKYQRKFHSKRQYKDFVDRIMRDGGTDLNKGEKKIVDFEVFGNRGNAIIDTVATKGITLTIRKHSENPVRLQDIIRQNVMSQNIADFIGTLIEGEVNLIYGGITGSGKTTTLRALINHYVPKLNKRILCLEDTPELFLKNEHTVELKTVHSNKKEESVTMETLILTALRMKPKYIVVGEVRGVEAEAAVEGMETGHSTIFSMHGGTVWNIINRLVTKYLMSMPSLGIEVVERIIGSAVDYVAIQDDVPGIGRRVTSIHEVSYDFDKRTVKATPIIEYSFETGKWDWFSAASAEKTRTMLRRGVSLDRVKEIQSLDYLKAQEQKCEAAYEASKK